MADCTNVKNKKSRKSVTHLGRKDFRERSSESALRLGSLETATGLLVMKSMMSEERSGLALGTRLFGALTYLFMTNNRLDDPRAWGTLCWENFHTG
eukprot:g14737.t1